MKFEWDNFLRYFKIQKKWIANLMKTSTLTSRIQNKEAFHHSKFYPKINKSTVLLCISNLVKTNVLHIMISFNNRTKFLGGLHKFRLISVLNSITSNKFSRTRYNMHFYNKAIISSQTISHKIL